MEALAVAGHDLGQPVDCVQNPLGGLVERSLWLGPGQHQDALLTPPGSVFQERDFLAPNEHPRRAIACPSSLAGDVERTPNMARRLTVNIGMFRPCVTGIREQSESR